MSDTSIIICRGESLSAIDLIDQNTPNNFDIYFVNRCRDLVDIETIQNLVKKSGKCYQYVNNEHINLETLETYSKLKIDHLQSNKKESDHDSPYFLKTNIFNNQIKISFIPEDVLENRYKLISSGLGCAGFCTTEKKYKKIIIIGLDFFESNYYHYHVHTGNKAVKEYQPAKGKKAKLQFFDLISNTPDVQFVLYTKADLSNIKNIKNLEIHQI